MSISNFLIMYGPTLLFLLLVVLGTLFGFIRGFRKSIILLIQGCIALTISVIFFFVIVNNKNVDTNIVTIINTFLGENGLQEKLSVSTSNKTLTDILIEFIPKQLNYGDGIALMLKDNGAYLLTLVNFSYRLIFILISTILYLLLVFIFYIIYFIFYPERRHKKHVIEKEIDTDKPYKKRRVFGLFVGTIRSFFTSILVLSFIGSIFYMVSGVGTTKTEGDLDDTSYSSYFDIYSDISEYGTTGIYKVLNTIKDKEQLPYYLYLSKIALSTNVNSETLNQNVYLPSELATYTNFSRDTINLLMKYGKDEIKATLSSDNPNIYDTIITIAKKDGFQEEFSKLIDNFESDTYFINFSLSLVDSFVKHIDEITMDGLTDDVKEPLLILFKDGYLSDYIPSEKNAKENGNTLTTSTINLSEILTKNDAKTLVKLLVKVLTIDNSNAEYESNGNTLTDKTQVVLNYLNQVVPELNNFSLFNGTRKNLFNPVLKRLYIYLNNKYLSQETLGNTITNEKEIKLSNTIDENSNIDMTDELSKLITSSNILIKYYSNIYKKDEEIFDLIMTSFEGEKKDENEALLNDLKTSLSESILLSDVLQSNFITTTIKNSLSSIGDIVIESDITYSNTYQNGVLVKYGETYNLLSSIIAVIKTDGLKDYIKEITNVRDLTDLEKLKLFKNILDYKDTNYENKTIEEYLLSSNYINSIISSLLISNKNISSDITLYIPNSVLKQDSNGNTINILENNELKQLINYLPDLLELMINYTDFNSSYFESYNYILQSSKIEDMLEDTIINGTISSALITIANTNEYIKIPKSINTVDEFVKQNELSNIVKAVKKSKINLDNFKGDITTSTIKNELKQIDKSSYDDLLNSSVLYYSLSYNLSTLKFDDKSLIIPDSVKEVLKDDSISYLITKEELKNLFNLIDDIVTVFDNYSDSNSEYFESYNYLLNNEYTLELIDDIIIEYTISNEILDIAKDNEFIRIPKSINTLDNFVSEKELPKIVNAIQATNFDLDQFKTTFDSDKLKKEIEEFSEKEVDTILDSKVLYYSISDYLFDLNVSNYNLIVPNEVRIELENDSIEYLIDKVELKNVILSIKYIDSTSVNEIFKNVVNNKESILISDVITSTVINYLFEKNTTLSSFLNISDFYKTNANTNNIINYKKNDAWYKEFSNLIDGVKELLDINDTFDVTKTSEIESDIKKNILNLNNISNIDNSKTKLELIYNSEILSNTLSTKIDEAITNKTDIVVRNYLKDKTLENSNVKVYRLSEVKGLIDGANSIGIDDISKVDSIDFDTKLFDLDIDRLYNSYLLINLITKTLNEEINNDSSNIESHKYAYLDTIDNLTSDQFNNIFNNSNPFVKEIEITSILNVLKESGINTISNVDLTNIKLNDTTINNILDSYILKRTITKHIKDEENVIIPYSIYDTLETTDESDDLIEEVELKACLLAIGNGMEGVNVSTIDFENIKPSDLKSENYGLISKSVIIRANISANTTAKDSTYMYVLNNSSYVSQDKDINSNTIYILSEDEILNMLNAISILNLKDSFEIVITQELIVSSTIEDLIELLKSNVVKCVLSDYILNRGFTISSVTIKYDTTYVISSFRNIDMYLFKESALKSYTYQLRQSETKYYFNNGVESSYVNLMDKTIKEVAMLSDLDILAYIDYLKNVSLSDYIAEAY